MKTSGPFSRTHSTPSTSTTATVVNDRTSINTAGVSVPVTTTGMSSGRAGDYTLARKIRPGGGTSPLRSAVGVTNIPYSTGEGLTEVSNIPNGLIGPSDSHTSASTIGLASLADCKTSTKLPVGPALMTSVGTVGVPGSVGSAGVTIGAGVTEVTVIHVTLATGGGNGVGTILTSKTRVVVIGGDVLLRHVLVPVTTSTGNSRVAPTLVSSNKSG